MNPKFIFVDLDGTLIDHEVGILSSSITAIKEAKKKGHKVFICTGRAKNEIDGELKDIPFDGYILSCGSLIIVDDKILNCEPLPLEKTRYIKNLFEEYHVGYGLEGSERSYLNDEALLLFQNSFSKEHGLNSELARSYMNSIKMLPIHEMKEEDEKQIVKVAFYTKEYSLCQALEAKTPEGMDYVLHAFEGNPILNGEYSQSHITKASGIDIVLNHYHASLEDTIAIGDSMNDASMIQHCALGIAMGNGSDKLKEISDYVCEPLKEDGLYKAFKTFQII